MFFAVVRASDNLVVGLQSSRTAPVDPSGDHIYHEVTEAEYAAINPLTHEQDGGPAFKKQGNNIVANPDNRKVLVIAINTADPTEGSPVQITFLTKNADGTPFNFTGTRNLGVSIGRDIRMVRLSMTGGIKTVNRTLPQSGRYEFFTAESSVYKVAGEVAFEVLEDW